MKKELPAELVAINLKVWQMRGGKIVGWCEKSIDHSFTPRFSRKRRNAKIANVFMAHYEEAVK